MSSDKKRCLIPAPRRGAVSLTHAEAQVLERGKTEKKPATGRTGTAMAAI